jgi:hypothetical protein
MATQKKTVSKSPIAMSVAKYGRAYEKNYDELLKENISRIRRATAERGNKGVKIMEQLAEKARRETNKQLGFTEAEARRRDAEKKKVSPRMKGSNKARPYHEGSYKK